MDNCSIVLNIKQTSDGMTDESELFTRGEFRVHKGSFFIDYDESVRRSPIWCLRTVCGISAITERSSENVWWE